MKYIFLVLSLMFVTAHAETNPYSLTRDSRVKQVIYDGEDVVNITGVDLIVTSIEFDESETILDVVIGDSGAWSVDRAQGRSFLLYIKPLSGDSDTNMQVVTNKRIYEFRLKSTDFEPQDMIYRLKFAYPDDIVEIEHVEEESLSEYKNYDYSYSGNSRVAPVEVYDNGHFTYFQFRGNRMPAIFSVEANRKEELVNYRIEEGSLVVEKISGQFTIRDEDLVTTIINHKYIQDLAHG